jgi:GNAT superfamily N-acetyltransferase
MGEGAVAFLTDPEDPRFAPLLRLYESAIPARERKDEAAIRGMAASPAHRVGVAIDGDRLAGFFLLHVGEAVALLEYLAVDPALRGRGLGARLVEAAREAAGDRPMLVEVESDRADAPDRALRARRIAFYRRLGCRRLAGLDYILPLPGEGPPPVMDLLVAGVDGPSLPTARVSSWLEGIYAAVYGCPRTDPRIGTMLAGFPATVILD